MENRRETEGTGWGREEGRKKGGGRRKRGALHASSNSPSLPLPGKIFFL